MPSTKRTAKETGHELDTFLEGSYAYHSKYVRRNFSTLFSPFNILTPIHRSSPILFLFSLQIYLLYGLLGIHSSHPMLPQPMMQWPPSPSLRQLPLLAPSAAVDIGLQSQLGDTQSSLASHLDKVRAFGRRLEVMKRDARTLRETMEERRPERGRPETADLVHQHTRAHQSEA